MIGRRAEAERFEARGREQQREHRAGDDDHRAAQREPHAPPIPDPADDVDELCPMVHVAALPNANRLHPASAPGARLKRRERIRNPRPPNRRSRILQDLATKTSLSARGDSKSLSPWPAAAGRPAADTTTSLAPLRLLARHLLRRRPAAAADCVAWPVTAATSSRGSIGGQVRLGRVEVDRDRFGAPPSARRSAGPRRRPARSARAVLPCPRPAPACDMRSPDGVTTMRSDRSARPLARAVRSRTWPTVNHEVDGS